VKYWALSALSLLGVEEAAMAIDWCRNTKNPWCWWQIHHCPVE
jgi:hypothetical protein